MPPPSTFVVAVVALIVISTVVQLLLLAYRNRDADSSGRTVDGDVVYSDDRLNEMLYARAPAEDGQDAEVDPEETETISCARCDAVNDASYTFCRRCTAELT